MLKGKVAGLYIVESGTSNGSVSNRGQVIMRGQASLPDAAIPISARSSCSMVLSHLVQLQDVVDASDIENITLLKDAASTAIYGFPGRTGRYCGYHPPRFGRQAVGKPGHELWQGGKATGW